MSSDHKPLTTPCGAWVMKAPHHFNNGSPLVMDYQPMKKLAHG